MTVKTLIKQLESCHPDAIVVLNSDDHSYSQVTHTERAVAESDGKGYLGEYFGDENMDAGSYTTNVVVIS